jgi:hypothetical protein
MPPTLEDIDCSRFLFGAAYDINPPLYDVLLASGYAVPDDDIGALPSMPSSPSPKRLSKRDDRRR